MTDLDLISAKRCDAAHARLAETQQRYKAAVQAQQEARSEFDAALASAFELGLTNEEMAGTLGVSRHRVYQLKSRINQQAER